MFRVVDQFYFHDHGTHAEANRYVTTTNAIWIGDIKKSFQLKRHRLFKNQMGRLQLARLSHAAAAATAMVMMMMTLRSEIVHSQLILNADGPWADKLWQMYATHRHTHDHVYNSSSAPLSVVLYFYFFFIQFRSVCHSFVCSWFMRRRNCAADVVFFHPSVSFRVE